jgi:hypothetical protein
MACPRWTRTRTQPVALDDVVALLGWVLGREETFGASYDVAGPEVVTYEQMMTTLARLLDLDRPMMPVPLVSPALSRLWVTLVTGAPRELVAPLIRSLEHEMLARDDRLMRAAGRSPLGLEAALQRALAGAQPDEEPHAFVGARPRDPSLGRVAGGLRTALSDEQAERPDDDGARPPSRPTVRSVQRMALPDGATAAWAAREYVRWLPQALSGILHVAVEQRDEGAICRFVLGSASRRGRGLVLLELTHAPQRSGAGRQLFYVTGGALHHPHAPGERPARFELRQISDPHLLLTAIHDYQSRLPWFVYTSTQAVVHALVMEAFRRHLAERARLGPVPATESAGGEVLFSVPEVKGALPLEPPIGYDTPSHDAR